MTITRDQMRRAWERHSFPASTLYGGATCRAFKEEDLIAYTEFVLDEASHSNPASKHYLIANAAWAFMKAYQHSTAADADVKRRELFDIIAKSVRPR